MPSRKPIRKAKQGALRFFGHFLIWFILFPGLAPVRCAGPSHDNIVIRTPYESQKVQGPGTALLHKDRRPVSASKLVQQGVDQSRVISTARHRWLRHCPPRRYRAPSALLLREKP